MANGHSLELMRWGGDKKVHLCWWDYMHGEDTNFVIDEDGTAYISSYMNDNDTEPTLTPVNLGLELVKLNCRIYGEDND